MTKDTNMGFQVCGSRIFCGFSIRKLDPSGQHARLPTLIQSFFVPNTSAHLRGITYLTLIYYCPVNYKRYTLTRFRPLRRLRKYGTVWVREQTREGFRVFIPCRAKRAYIGPSRAMAPRVTIRDTAACRFARDLTH